MCRHELICSIEIEPVLGKYAIEEFYLKYGGIFKSLLKYKSIKIVRNYQQNLSEIYYY